MDRTLVYPGSIPLDTDLLSVNRNAMIAIGYLAQAVLGTNTVVDGLACAPTLPASMTVTVGPGSITQLGVVDALAYGSLPADATDPLLKMGVNVAPTSFTLTAPTTSGQAVNYLIQATLLESDTAPIILPYYNAANPSQPYSGPNNSGVAQNTARLQRVSLQLKAGAPANAGSQATPPTDNGWVGLYVVTVNYGQSAITGASIAALPAAPFVPFKLPSLRPGFASGRQVFTSSGTFVVPAGVTLVEVTVTGGGGGSAACTNGTSSGGGGAGGTAIRACTVTPGSSIAVTVGGGGGGGGGGSGGNGGTSSFGAFCNATGGTGSSSQGYTGFPSGGAGGAGAGGDINIIGGYGSDGASNGVGGGGGASLWGGGGRPVSGGGAPGNGQAYGSGAGGPYNGASNGCPGAAGVVMVRW
jgi:hypothetical protein